MGRHDAKHDFAFLVAAAPGAHERRARVFIEGLGQRKRSCKDSKLYQYSGKVPRIGVLFGSIRLVCFVRSSRPLDFLFLFTLQSES